MEAEKQTERSIESEGMWGWAGKEQWIKGGVWQIDTDYMTERERDRRRVQILRGACVSHCTTFATRSSPNCPAIPPLAPPHQASSRHFSFSWAGGLSV